MLDRHRLNYIYSLLPDVRILPHVRSVRMQVTAEVNISADADRLEHANGINPHLYKPVYSLESSNRGQVLCQVATPTVSAHVVAAWRTYTASVGTDVTIEQMAGDDGPSLVEQLYKVRASQLVRSLAPRDVVLFAKLESIRKYLRMMDLIHVRQLDKDSVEQLFVELELATLNGSPSAADEAGTYSRYLDARTQEYLFTKVPANPVRAGTFLSGQNFNVLGTEITVIDLPWGMDLSYLVARAVMDAGVRSMVYVGGIGSIADSVEVDDIFVAEEVRLVPEQGIQLDNDFVAAMTSYPQEKLSKNWCKGALLCVNSSFNHPAGFSAYAKQSGVTAFDMESWGFLSAAREYGSSLSMIHYIMDLPMRGFSFGATYYDRAFRSRLLASRNRGKYFCFNMAIKHLAGEYGHE
jgi:purine-nucleoside phosphorylase